MIKKKKIKLNSLLKNMRKRIQMNKNKLKRLK